MNFKALNLCNYTAKQLAMHIAAAWNNRGDKKHPSQIREQISTSRFNPRIQLVPWDECWVSRFC